MTNRDLYLAIGELKKRHASSSRTLETYLLALLGMARPYQEQSGLSSSEFIALLAEAFTADPLAFDEGWREQYAALDWRSENFEGCEAILIRQIVDLREMDETGTLRDEQRYFGIASPRKGFWFNFSPASYLECGAAGSIGGWEPDDPTGRQFVPGQVGVLDTEGGLQSVDPEDVERPIFQIVQLTWEDFQNFLRCGQTYE